MTVISSVIDIKIIMFLIAITTLFVAVSADSTQVLSVAKPERPVNYTEFNHTVYANNVGIDELVKLNEIIRQQRALGISRPRRHMEDDRQSLSTRYHNLPPHEKYFIGLQQLNRTGTEFMQTFSRYQDSLFGMLCVSSSNDRHIYARMANSIQNARRHLNHIKSHLQEYMNYVPRDVDMCV